MTLQQLTLDELEIEALRRILEHLNSELVDFEMNRGSNHIGRDVQALRVALVNADPDKVDSECEYYEVWDSPGRYRTNWIVPNQEEEREDHDPPEGLDEEEQRRQESEWDDDL